MVFVSGALHWAWPPEVHMIMLQLFCCSHICLCGPWLSCVGVNTPPAGHFFTCLLCPDVHTLSHTCSHVHAHTHTHTITYTHTTSCTHPAQGSTQCLREHSGFLVTAVEPVNEVNSFFSFFFFFPIKNVAGCGGSHL